MMPSSSPAPRLAAAVDLGSNSFHLVLARVEGGRISILDHLRDQVQLAAGLDEQGRLDTPSCRRGLECLQRYAQRLQGLPREDIRVVGTSALRSARNARDFLEPGERILGAPIEVIPGEEEARLIHLGVAREITAVDRPLLVVDIGGGSTEFGLSDAGGIRGLRSLDLGCVTLSRRHFPEAVVTSRAWGEAKAEALAALEELRGFVEASSVRAVGASGTIRTAFKVVRFQGWGKEWLDAERLHRIEKRLLATGRLEKVRLSGLKSARLPVFPGGLVILQAVFEALGLERMEVTRSALREGVLMELLDRKALRDRRDESVSELLARHGCDSSFSGRVEAIAARIFCGIGDGWEHAIEEPERFLRWAARACELGLRLAYKDHHLHGAYLIQNSELPGFGESDRRFLAAIVACSRRALPVTYLDALEEPRRQSALLLVLVLRAAMTLARTPLDELPPGSSVEARERELRLCLPRGFLTRHPLCEHELALEADRLAKQDLILSWRAV
jgi:exopolyphosphatase/guanosine-5'-triphosphate,3'-diphosphate pyrophosphatase